jgi:hypothetical protein
MNFEKIVLPERYESKKIISIQGLGNLFFSDKLVESCLKENLTSFRISNRKIEISFK